MGRIADLIRTRINNYITGIVTSRVKSEISALLFTVSGDDSPPLPDDKVFIVKKDGSGDYAIVGVLAMSQGAVPGEKKLYSRDSEGNLKSLIYIKKDGTIEINGNADNAVRFNSLDVGLQAFISDLNFKLTTAFATVPYTWPGSSIDIAGAKIEEVKLP